MAKLFDASGRVGASAFMAVIKIVCHSDRREESACRGSADGGGEQQIPLRLRRFGMTKLCRFGMTKAEGRFGMTKARVAFIRDARQRAG